MQPRRGAHVGSRRAATLARRVQRPVRALVRVRVRVRLTLTPTPTLTLT